MTPIFWTGVAGMAWTMLVFVSALFFPGVSLSEPRLQEVVLVSALGGPLLASLCFFMCKGCFIKIIALVCLLLFCFTGGAFWLLKAFESGETEIARTQVGDSIVTACQVKAGSLLAIEGGARDTVFIRARKKIPPFFERVRQLGQDNNFKGATPNVGLLVAVDSTHVRWRHQIFEVR